MAIDLVLSTLRVAIPVFTLAFIAENEVKKERKKWKKEGNADQSHRILPQVSVHLDQASPTKPCPEREEVGCGFYSLIRDVDRSVHRESDPVIMQLAGSTNWRISNMPAVEDGHGYTTTIRSIVRLVKSQGTGTRGWTKYQSDC